MTLALRRQAGKSSPGILGADFSHAMLQRASQKAAATPLRWIEADALRLPFPDEHFDLITSAFGFRNLANYDAGLQEIMRVLRPGGEFGILDFGEPRGLVGNCYRIYFKRVLPAIGTLISGVKGPYAYLPASVARFPAPDEMLQRIRQTGFHESSWTPTPSASPAYIAEKSSAGVPPAVSRASRPRISKDATDSILNLSRRLLHLHRRLALEAIRKRVRNRVTNHILIILAQKLPQAIRIHDVLAGHVRCRLGRDRDDPQPPQNLQRHPERQLARQRNSLACATSMQRSKVKGSPRPATLSTVNRCASGSVFSRIRVISLAMSSTCTNWMRFSRYRRPRGSMQGSRLPRLLMLAARSLRPPGVPRKAPTM